MIHARQEFVLAWAAGPQPAEYEQWIRADRALVAGDLEDELPWPGSRMRVLHRGPRPEQLPDWLAFDGVATGDGADGALSPLRSLANSGRASTNIATHLRGTVGCFTGLVRIAVDRVVIVADPFGAGLIVFCKLPRVTLASNSVWFLEDVARAWGHRLTRVVTSIATETLLRSSPFGATGFAEVERLPIGAVAEGTDRQGLRILEDSDPGRRSRPTASFREHVTAAAAEITASVHETRSRIPDQQPATCDLSGGQDSRLVTAAAFAAGLRDAFTFTCWGDHSAPDYTAFAYLREAFDLQETPSARTGASYTLARSPTEALRAFMFRSMGIISDFHGLGRLAREPVSHGLLLTGGFPLHKGNGQSPEAPASVDVAVDEVLARAPWRSTKRLVSPGIADQARSRMLRTFERTVADGDSLQAAQFRWYVESRNRDHFGLVWQMRLREPALVFHPLYSPNAALAAHAISDTERARGRVTFELFRHLYEPLATLPFAGRTWHPALYAGDPRYAILALQRPITATSPRLTYQDRPTPAVADPAQVGSTAMSPWQRRHRMLGRPSWQVYFDRVLSELTPLARDTDRTSAMWDAFDRESTLRLVTRGLEDTWSAPTMLFCYRLFAAIIWESRTEDQVAPTGEA